MHEFPKPFLKRLARSKTGNSFAAPAIAGAAAILKQNWPQRGRKAISRILLDSATDLCRYSSLVSCSTQKAATSARGMRS